MAGDCSVLENVDITQLKCPKFFSQDCKLRMHLWTKTCNKPCTWIQCPKNYTGEKPYYKSFVKDSKIRTHLKTNVFKKWELTQEKSNFPICNVQRHFKKNYSMCSYFTTITS